MNNKFKILIVVFLLLSLTGCIKSNNNNKIEYLETISYSELETLINQKKDFIIYIGSDTCPACEKFTPNFKEVLTKYKIYAKYIDINALKDEEISLLNDFIAVENIPTVAFIYSGDEASVVNRIVGVTPKNEIINKLKDNNYIK